MLIPASDTLYVTGNLTVSSASTITVNGYIKVTGNVTTSGSSSVCGSGGGIYLGSLTGPSGTPGWCFAPVTVPIQLISFDASYIAAENSVKANWVTASEVNNNYFTLERALDGNSFEPVGKINGAGNSNAFKEYSFIDPSPIKGISYYRLVQTDNDGTNTVYARVPVEVTDATMGSNFIIFPNPAQNNVVYITITGEKTGEKVVFIVKDLMGRIIQQETFEVNHKGATVYQLNTEKRIGKGVYFITGFVNNKVSTQRLIVN